MIHKQYAWVVAFFVCMGTVFCELNACMITFINDSNAKVLVFNKNENNLFFLPKNARRRFGSARKHANFGVYVQQPKTQLFTLAYSCRQHECGKKGNPQIKFSDLESNGGEARVFSIIKNKKPHTSMVRELPMIQKEM